MRIGEKNKLLHLCFYIIACVEKMNVLSLSSFRKKIRIFFKKIMLIWKIVRVSEVLVIYIYIYIEREREREREREIIAQITH